MLTIRALVNCNRLSKNYVVHNLKNISIFERKVLLPSNKNFQIIRLASSSTSVKNDDTNSVVEKIYYGTLTSQIRAVKLFSLITSVSGIAAQPILMEQGNKIGGTPMVVFLCTFVGFFTFVTPILLHWITKKYVTEINYYPIKDQYTLTTLSIFLRRKNVTFKISDITVPEVPGMFTTFLIGKKGYFVDPRLFPEPTHYVKMMGYDKPMDFKLDLTEKDVSTENIENKK